MSKFESATSVFFRLGDKVTKGDPRRKAEFDYYLLWVMFIAFLLIFISDISSSIKYFGAGNLLGGFKSLGWGFVIFAIMWFQYSALKQSWGSMKMIKKLKNPVVNFNSEDEEDSFDKDDEIEEMLEEFDNE